MNFLGTPQLRAGVDVSFFFKVSFLKHPNVHTFSYFDLGRENENRETLQAEFEFSHLLYDIKVSLIVGELHPSHAKLFVQGHFVCGVYFSE